MYLLWVSGNLAYGKIGELNFITYILLRGPTSVDGSFGRAFLLTRFLRAGFSATGA